MAASFDGSGAASPAVRTNRSRAGPLGTPLIAGFHCVAGASSGASATLRGPARRSSSGAIDRRQFAAAMSRSGALIVVCISFSASSNVAAETGGPDSGPAPKVGGAPGVGGGEAGVVVCSPPHAAALTIPIDAVIRKCRRVFMQLLDCHDGTTKVQRLRT